MKNPDAALSISNPRLISAIYFSLLAIIATLVIDTILYALGVHQILPIFQGILLAVIIAAPFGALFGERIIHSKAPYHKRVFWLGFFMVILAMPIYDIGLFFLLKSQDASLFAQAPLMQLLHFYLMIWFYSFIVAGLWLAILGGIAAIYLRGYLVDYILDSLNTRPEFPRKDQK